jgi:VWFA-related protein
MYLVNKLGGILWASALVLCVFGRVAAGRQADEEVVRVNAELVQVGVSVFDGQGRFVDGLKREDFELRVDGRAVPITFFENIVAGSLRDRLARAAAGEAAPVKAAAPSPSRRQPTVVFFLDDRHLSPDSVARMRRMLLDFIDREMGEDDLVAVASADLSARAQVFREGREVSATPHRKIVTDAQTDPARIPFTAEIDLGGLQPGRYTLRVTAEDRAANQSASQQTAFYVQ